MNKLDKIKKSVIIEDYSDTAFMKEVCETFGDSTEPLYGENVEGEKIELSVHHNRLTIRTHQKNHWDRINTYWLDGTVEETFDAQARKEYMDAVRELREKGYTDSQIEAELG